MRAAAPCGSASCATRARRGGRASRVGRWRGAAALAALCCAALLRPAAAKETQLSLTHVNNADPLAVCNDGSVGAFYMHTASDPTLANVWLIYLEGGQWCAHAAHSLTRAACRSG